jgi:hypothetical protein
MLWIENEVSGAEVSLKKQQFRKSEKKSQQIWNCIIW